MRAEEAHTRVQPGVKVALKARAAKEGVTLSALIAKVLTQTVARWRAKA
jgi:predicted HicB family RNase H-like nuclease